MTYDYKEKRTKHALAVDRGKNAKERFSRFNERYGNRPNRSDVDEYDTRTRPVEAPQPPPKIRPGMEYVPEGQEKARLMSRFHTLPPMQQHKDLLTTRNVVRSAEGVKKWEKNPRAFDIRGIDTQPPELTTQRLKVARQHAGNPAIRRYNTRSFSRAGSYKYRPMVPEDPGRIIINTGITRHIDRTEAHEIGHAYDRNTIGKNTARVFGDTGNVIFGPFKAPKKRLPRGLSIEVGINKSKVTKVTQEKINPFNPMTAPGRFIKYRGSNEELFANWFAGLVTMKSTVKKDTRGFYNVFRKANKPLMKALRRSDRKVTRKYVKGILI